MLKLYKKIKLSFCFAILFLMSVAINADNTNMSYVCTRGALHVQPAYFVGMTNLRTKDSISFGDSGVMCLEAIAGDVIHYNISLVSPGGTGYDLGFFSVGNRPGQIPLNGALVVWGVYWSPEWKIERITQGI